MCRPVPFARLTDCLFLPVSTLQVRMISDPLPGWSKQSSRTSKQSADELCCAISLSNAVIPDRKTPAMLQKCSSQLESHLMQVTLKVNGMRRTTFPSHVLPKVAKRRSCLSNGLKTGEPFLPLLPIGSGFAIWKRDLCLRVNSLPRTCLSLPHVVP